MLRKCLIIAVFAIMACPFQALAFDDVGVESAIHQDQPFERGAVLQVKKPVKTTYKGNQVNSVSVQTPDHGLVLQDNAGGIIVIPGAPTYGANINQLDARELKLKIRELAAQLVTGLDKRYANHIALPTAFVAQDDFTRSSSFGRYISEQLYYELNQRGLRTKEYRLTDSMVMREDGEFLLTRNVQGTALNASTLYIVGTYYTDGTILLVNARMVNSGGDIIRTGQLILNVNPLTKRMLANSGRRIQEGTIELLDFNSEARLPETVTAFDQGMDIH
ncbi:hypothetical protein LJB93_03480 [Desulfovibrio sp. OttesenSCG-928-F07]|nr:hypothetical protein [Desulfovibrio sp. OttesenSCG-928-F07]